VPSSFKAGSEKARVVLSEKTHIRQKLLPSKSETEAASHRASSKVL
jgi:hypothetical protein